MNLPIILLRAVVDHPCISPEPLLVPNVNLQALRDGTHICKSENGHAAYTRD